MATDEELRTFEFLGFTSGMFCAEVHAILHNEFLGAVKNMKEKMIKVYPDRAEEVHKCCTALLISYSEHLTKQMRLFSKYFVRNFKIPKSIPLHGEDITESKGAREAVIELRKKIVATQELNRQLKEKIKQTEERIVARETMKAELSQLLLKQREIEETKEKVDKLHQEFQSLTSK